VRVNHEAFQATDLSPMPGAAAMPVGPTPARPGEPSRVGIVFVHGIGTQKPAETFLDWSSSMVRMLEAWRLEQGFGVDPVVRSQFAFSHSALPFLELDIPASGDRDASRWIVTEALWAEAIRAPSLDVVGRYLRDRLWSIVSGIRAGYRIREDSWHDRTTATSAEEAADFAPADRWIADRIDELGRGWWGWIGAIDALQRSILTQWLVVVPLVALATLLLTIWAPLRKLPIGPLRDFAEARIVDSFLTDWFGDLPVLLDDPVQAANVRARVAEAVSALEGQGCDSIVLVAHSGGAIVSFETLLDPAYLPESQRPIHVDKLVTIGEGLKLGWRLEGAEGRPLERGNRTAGDLGAARPRIRWVDVWATFDPAPAGPLVSPTDVVLDVGKPGDRAVSAADSPTGRLVVESRPVTNFMSLRNDHGGYWDNDEGYLVPLLRHIDDPRGSGQASRFYRNDALRTVRIERRRQRVAVLGAWRWLVAGAGAVAVIAGGLTAGAPRLAGTTAIGIWNRVPGGELIAAPIAAVWGAIGTLLSLFGRNAIADSLPAIGPVIVGAVVIGLVFAAVGQIGDSAWSRWDVREREAARLERLPALDRRYAAAGFVTAIAALVTLAVATLSAGAGARVGLILASGTFLGVALSALVVALMPEPEAADPGAGTSPTLPASAPPAAPASSTPPSAASRPAIRRRPARGTPRTPSAAPRTSRPASRRRPRSG
jgi:hypothetical protein